MKKGAFRLLSGKLSVHPAGYGFVTPDPPLSPDVFIPPDRLNQAIHGDRVSIRLLKRKAGARIARRKGKRGPEAEVIEILSRSPEGIIGKLVQSQKDTLVTPLDPRYPDTIRVIDGVPAPVPEGQIVAVTLIGRTKQGRPLGKLLQVIGDPDEPDIQYRIVCHIHQIPREFPQQVLDEAAAAEEPGEREIARRRDFRGQTVVTIDGVSARDFDDAVSIRPGKDGSFELGVHIADVAHYVRPETPLDREAYTRGTSVYFPDRAIPMLPEGLSNGLCSLKPQLPRLTVSVIMQIDRKGKVQRSHFFESVIQSEARLTYDAVHGVLSNGGTGHGTLSSNVEQQLFWMLDLSRLLRERRHAAGAIDFDLPEAEIRFDAQGEVVDIRRAHRNEAHRLIEEFMLLANETVASHFSKHNLPVIYRIHEAPDPLKVEEFMKIAESFGHRLPAASDGVYSSRSFQQLADHFKGRKEEKFLAYLMLRSFQQARYSAVNRGHFGLASTDYTHFTSPIRRYPDLIVQRLLKAFLNGKSGASSAQPETEFLTAVSRQSSERERHAVEAEREITRWLMAGFMQHRLGEEFEAIVVGVKENGFFVELIDHFVEGFVPVHAMADDYYVYSSTNHALRGKNTHRVFRTGDPVTVRVDQVDPQRNLIDFSVAS